MDRLVERESPGSNAGRIRPGRDEKKKAAPEGGCDSSASRIQAPRFEGPVRLGPFFGAGFAAFAGSERPGFVFFEGFFGAS